MIESLQFIKGDFVVPQSFQYNFKVQIFFVTGCHFQLPVSFLMVASVAAQGTYSREKVIRQ